MAIETESTLVEQSKDAELEYRVIAINKLSIMILSAYIKAL